MFKQFAAVTAAALILVGCGEQVEPVGTAPSSPSVTQSQTTPPEPIETWTPTEEPEPTPEPEQDLTYTFGETAKFADGLLVTISKPKAFKPGEYAAGTDGFKTFVRFTITVENKTSGRIELIGVTNLMSGETEGSAVFDMDANLGGPPSTPLLPGKKVSYAVGFGVTNANDLVMEYTPTFEHDGVIFTSTGA